MANKGKYMDSSKLQRAFPFFYYWLIVFIFMSIIFYYSTTSLKIKPYYPNQDKTLHFVVYAGLGFLMKRAFFNTLFSNKKKVAIYISILSASFFGAFIEVCQIYCNRSFEIADIIANSLGATAGCFLYIFFYKKIYPKMRKKFSIISKIEKYYEENRHGSLSDVL